MKYVLILMMMISSYGVMAEDIAISPDCFKDRDECEKCAKDGVAKYSAKLGADKFKITRFKEGSVCNFKVFSGRKKVAQSKDKQIKVKGFYCDPAKGKIKKIKVADLTMKHSGNTVYKSREDAEKEIACKKNLYVCVVENGSEDVKALQIKDGEKAPSKGEKYKIVGSKLHKKERKALKDRDCKGNDPKYVCAVEKGSDTVVALLIKDGDKAPTAGVKYKVVGTKLHKKDSKALKDKDCKGNAPKYVCAVEKGSDTVVALLIKDGETAPTAGEKYSVVGTTLHKKERKALKDKVCKPTGGACVVVDAVGSFAKNAKLDKKTKKSL